MGQSTTHRISRLQPCALFCALLLAALCLPAFSFAQVKATITATNLTCFGGPNNGTATATGSGGQEPYTFNWSTGATTAAINNLAPGAYNVTVTDKNAATGIASVNIIQPNALTVTVFGESQICAIAPDGKAAAVPAGGTIPYTYKWNTNATGAQITDLKAGTYTVTVTDVNGCTVAKSANVDFWDEGLWLMDTAANVTCFGLKNGFAEVGPMSGTAPYTYKWSDGQSAKRAINLAPGLYTVTVVDAKGCSRAISKTVGEPAALTASASSTAASCSNTGSATVTGAGGNAPYTVVWSNGAVTTTIRNVAVGSYTATVTDSKGCTATATASVGGANASLTVTGALSAPAGCNAGGSATASITGGAAPYTYVWSNGQTTATATNLIVGAYTVTVKDANNCTGTGSVNVPQATPILAVAAVTTNATCATGGTATASATGGVAPYTYRWSNGATTAAAGNLPGGAYSVTVTDATGCIGTASVTLAQGGGPAVTVTANTKAGCGTGGSATATATGGAGTYTYLWDNGQTTAIGTNLSAGTRRVTVTDGAGCSNVGTVTIDQVGNLSASAAITTQATCTTGATLTAAGSNGAAPYTYKWSNGQTTAVVTNIGAGTYTVTVSDGAGCSVTATAAVVAIGAPVVAISVTTPATCATGATVTVTTTGGQTPYTYAWSNGVTATSATNLNTGTYTVTVTDANKCTGVASVTVVRPSAPTVTTSVTANATCAAGGNITTAVSGGAAPYTYKWSSGQTTANLSNVPAGTYTVTVTDANNCTGTATATVTQPPTLAVVIASSSNAKCNNQAGSATIGVSGGTAPYTYKWSSGATTISASLQKGSYTVTVTDGAGCTGTTSVSIGVSESGIRVGDFVWFDKDQDGFQHTLEAGVPNIAVALLQAGPDGKFETTDDVTLATTTTNAQGKYQFECVSPGQYIITFSGIPAGFQYAAKDKVNNDCADSDAKPNGRTSPFSVVAGQSDNLCIDAGIHSFCDNVVSAGTIAADQIICEGETPAKLYEVTPPALGSGPIEYLWMHLISDNTGGVPQWVTINTATTRDFQPGPLYKTAYFMRCVRRKGCETFLETNIVTVTVLPAGAPGCGQFINDFRVSQRRDQKTLIEWTAMPESAAFLYIVEHSMDSTKWRQVTSVAGRQDPVNPNNYSVTDEAPLKGMNYYRVKRQDGRGHTAVSPLRQLMIGVEGADAMLVYPNPVINDLHIRNLAPQTDDVIVRLADAQGRIVATETIRAGMLEKIDLSVENLPFGLYMAYFLFNNGEVKTVKLMKN